MDAAPLGKSSPFSRDNQQGEPIKAKSVSWALISLCCFGFALTTNGDRRAELIDILGAKIK
jgi:hypothetical protein